eukprot:6018948-Pyramimonas_sp.AAC.1
MRAAFDELRQMKTLLDRGGDDPQVLEKALEAWPTTKLSDAVSAYPMGREMFKEIKASVTVLKDRAKNTSDMKLKLEIPIEALTADDVRDVNAMLQQRDTLMNPEALVKPEWVQQIAKRDVTMFFRLYVSGTLPTDGKTKFKTNLK